MVKILIVEDEEVIIKVMKKTFSVYGECETTQTAENAMELFKNAFDSKSPFELILLDISLEEGSGLSVLKNIREFEKEKNIDKNSSAKIIMTTGNRSEKTVKEAIAAGCNGYIIKPVKPEIAKEKLEKLNIKPLEKPLPDKKQEEGKKD